MDSPSSQPGWSRLEAWLDQALELPIDRRGTLLERVGREDPALRERVEQLLAADAAAGDFLNDVSSGEIFAEADARQRTPVDGQKGRHSSICFGTRRLPVA